MALGTASPFDRARGWVSLLIGGCIPISTALLNILMPVALLLVLADANNRPNLRTLYQNPIAVLAALLFAYFALGNVYTSAPFGEALSTLSKYRELLYICLFILLFRDTRMRRLGIYAFLAAMALTLAISYGVALSGSSIGKITPENPYVFKTHITQAWLMSLAVYLLAVIGLRQSRWRWALAIGVGLGSYNVVFMTQARTGYLVFACLTLLFCYQVFRLRGLLMGTVAVTALSGVIYLLSANVQTRIDEISSDLQDYRQGNTLTSIAYRYEYYTNSLILIARHPLLGTGTGSFRTQYQTLVDKKGIQPTKNPHNEYILMAVQWGLVGAGLFIFLLYRMWKLSARLGQEEAWMAQGLIVAMAVGCIFNSLLLDFAEGHLFAYLTGLLYAGLTPVSPSHA